MKKTFLTIGVSSAIICCTLAYAATRQGRMQIDPESILLASSRVEETSNKNVAKAEASDQGNVQESVFDLWNTATQITPMYDGSTFDAATNTLSFSGGSDQTNHAFTEVTPEGYFGWLAENQTYQFSGTLTSTGDATVKPCIFYTDGSTIYIGNSTTVELNEANGRTSDFHVSATGIQEGLPILVGFLIENSSSDTTITSTENRFYYSIETIIPEDWTSENDLPGLGLNGFTQGTYIVRCADGVTTLGLYYDESDNSLYLTGINTTAAEVTIPQHVTIGSSIMQIHSFGYNNQMDWSGAPNLARLDISGVSELDAPFSGSAVTDLYIQSNFNIKNDQSAFSEIYLHIPYGAQRDNYTYYSFKRVLVGDEQPDYPVTSNSEWVIAGENEGDFFGISEYDGYYCISEIFTDKESVQLPVATPATGGRYYIRKFGIENYHSNLLCRNATALKSVTIPSTYTRIDVNWSNYPIVDLHMQGDVPTTNWSLTSNMKVYVGNQSYYANYENNSMWNNAAIVPDGWEFEWMTVNVGRMGEFAQTYIEMTDADWALGMYVKITGKLNTTDLLNIKNLTSLMKLDLREAEFSGLPNQFMESHSTLREVYLPEHVTYIPQSAFRYCTKLSMVSAPGVTSVGNHAFGSCNKLTDFDLSKVEVIDYSAFYDCRLFNPTDLSSVKTIGSEAFYNTAIREVVIPEGVSIIASNSFSDCSQLTKVTLPNTIRSIDYNAFNNCRALSSINLPEGITAIGSRVFSNCPQLSEITLPSTLVSLGSEAFTNCYSLLTVKCKAIVPPAASGEFTTGLDLNHCVLYVAPFTIDAFRAAPYWRDFYIMKPLDEPVKNIYISRPMTFDLLSADNAVLQENPNMTLDYKNSYDSYGNNVGQLSASGDGTLSAGVFKILHGFSSRSNTSHNDYRTTLVNNAENMRADSVLCSISFEKNKWHFISFQYDVRMEDIHGMNNTDFVIRQYNSTNRASGDGTVSNWEDVPADGVLEAGKGYIIQAANNSMNDNGNSNPAIVRFPSRNTVTKNKLFTSNNVIVPLEEYPAEFAHNRSWNLMGNPYPCYYDMHYLMDDFTTPIVLWRGTNYQAYSPVDDDIILRPNEAFFVQRPLDAAEMVFGVEGRMHYSQAYANDTNPGIKVAPASGSSLSDRAVFNFNIEGCGTDDRARIVINENASMEYEIERDASKFFAESAEGAEIYVDGNVRYDICERPLADGTAALGTRIGTNGEYTISLSGRNIAEWEVTLIDTLTGIITDLTKESYTFDAETGSTEGRFIITFKAPGQTSVEEMNMSDGTNIVRIVNTAGMTVFNGDLEEFKTTAPAGIYIVVSAEKTYKMVVK